MRIGFLLSNGPAARVTSFEDLFASVQGIADDGFHSVWFAHSFSGDALTLIAIFSQRIAGIELGTAVVPSFPRHPMALAQQALTTQLFARGRLTLGVGLSHPRSIEEVFGYSYERPARHMKEYLSILVPLANLEGVDFRGETLVCRGKLFIPEALPVPVMLAALAPRMLELAGTYTAGTITWMAGPRTIAEHVAPLIQAAAAKAGRAAPRIVVGVPVCVSDDPEAARRRAAVHYVRYEGLPSYQAMLQREGVAQPADVAVVGAEDSVRAQLAALAQAGATDLMVDLFGLPEEVARTRALLRSMLPGEPYRI